MPIFCIILEIFFFTLLETMRAQLDDREEDKRVQEEIQRKLKEKEERKRNVEKLRKERLKKQKEDEDKVQALNEAERRNAEVRYFLYLFD